jgi:hypothetical protein
MNLSMKLCSLLFETLLEQNRKLQKIMGIVVVPFFQGTTERRKATNPGTENHRQGKKWTASQ